MIVERNVVIPCRPGYRHHPVPAGLEDPVHFADKRQRILNMLQHLGADEVIHGIGLERNVRAIEAHDLLVGVAEGLGPMDVEPDVLRHLRSQQMLEGTRAGADVEDLPRDTWQKSFHVPVDGAELKIHGETGGIRDLVDGGVGRSVCRGLEPLGHRRFPLRKPSMSSAVVKYRPPCRIDLRMNLGRFLVSSKTFMRYSPRMETDRICTPPKKRIRTMMAVIPWGMSGYRSL